MPTLALKWDNHVNRRPIVFCYNMSVGTICWWLKEKVTSNLHFGAPMPTTKKSLSGLSAIYKTGRRNCT